MKDKKNFQKYFSFSKYKNHFKKIINYYLKNYKKISFSQVGEDIIIKNLFDIKGISRPNYIDIGAHHPIYLNNTALFYKRGCNGINIEPDPELFQKLRKKRKRDINLNIGIMPEKANLDYYVMSAKTLNTFSREVAYRLQNESSYNIKKILKIPVENITTIINNYCNGVFPDFLSIDTEGYDFDILKSIDYNKSKPKVICVETLTFVGNEKPKKLYNIINFLTEMDYILVSDTYINSIFIDKEFWDS